MPYINGKKEDWSFMCEFDRIVSKQDDVIWRYEEFVADPKHIDKTGFGSNDMS